jgi:hypothetical protein
MGWAKDNGKHHLVLQKRDVTDTVLGMAATHLMYGSDSPKVSINIETQDGPLGTLTFERHIKEEQEQPSQVEEFAN